MPLTRQLPLAIRFALREVHGGLRGFGVVLACVALGVAIIAGVGSSARGRDRRDRPARPAQM